MQGMLNAIDSPSAWQGTPVGSTAAPAGYPSLPSGFVGGAAPAGSPSLPSGFVGSAAPASSPSLPSGFVGSAAPASSPSQAFAGSVPPPMPPFPSGYPAQSMPRYPSMPGYSATPMDIPQNLGGLASNLPAALSNPSIQSSLLQAFRNFQDNGMNSMNSMSPSSMTSPLPAGANPMANLFSRQNIFKTLFGGSPSSTRSGSFFDGGGSSWGGGSSSQQDSQSAANAQQYLSTALDQASIAYSAAETGQFRQRQRGTTLRGRRSALRGSSRPWCGR